MLPVITIFCPFTRLEMMDRWFDDLASTDLDPSQTNLAFIIDTDEEEPLIYARIMQEMNRTKFRKFLITRNRDHHVNPVNIPIRRKRIAEIHNQSKAMISELDGVYVLGLEDDTVFTNLSVKRLYQPFLQYEDCGLVSTYEAGRWHNKIIGIWQFDDVNNPTQCWTMLPDKYYEEIDAAGMYCYLTPKELYLEHHYNSQDWEPWGPDVNYGLYLRREGYRNFVDWSQPCGHSDGGIIITPNNNLYTEHFFKQDIGDINAWVRKRQDV